MIKKKVEEKPKEYEILKVCPIEGDIFSVKRLSDGEIFTIGDNIKNFQYPIREMKRAYYDKSIWLDTTGSKLVQGCDLSVAVKVPKFEFKCEDGIVTDPEQRIFGLCIASPSWEHSAPLARYIKKSREEFNGYKDTVWKFFITKEKRTEYEMYNRALLTYHDVMSIDHAGNGNFLAITKERLINLLKSKI